MKPFTLQDLIDGERQDEIVEAIKDRLFLEAGLADGEPPSFPADRSAALAIVSGVLDVFQRIFPAMDADALRRALGTGRFRFEGDRDRFSLDEMAGIVYAHCRDIAIDLREAS